MIGENQGKTESAPTLSGEEMKVGNECASYSEITGVCRNHHLRDDCNPECWSKRK